MPLLLLPLLLALFAFLTPIALSPLSAPPVPPAIVATVPVVQMHYTRGGIVQINSKTGATRFIPYRQVQVTA